MDADGRNPRNGRRPRSGPRPAPSRPGPLPAPAATSLPLLALGALLLLGTPIITTLPAAAQSPAGDRDATERTGERERGLETSTLQGRVVFPASGEPVRDAEVVLLNGTRRTFTDAGGRFEIRGVRPGRELLQVRLAGERTRPEMILVPAGYRLSVELTAPPTGARTMEELVVRVERERSRWEREIERFERRARTLGRRYVDRELIRELDPTDLSEIFTYLSPAFAPPSRFTFDGVFRLRMRRLFAIRGGATTIVGRPRAEQGVFGPQSGVGFCTPTVFVNGALWTAPLGDLPPDDVIGLTLYESPFVPGEYRLHADRCGVVVAWTDWSEPRLGPERTDTE